MVEIWKDIKDFEGRYQISNFGNVKSVARYVEAGANANHEYQHLKERYLRLSGGGKYRQVILCKNGRTHAKLVHRLVAEAFIPNPNNLPCINHKDENPNNNCVDNLEWCTYKYNNEYNNRIGKCKSKISKTLTGRKRTYKVTNEQRKHISEGAKRGWETRRKNIQKKIYKEDLTMIKVGEWKDCVKEPPTVAGDYLVAHFYRGELSNASNIHFIPEYGWNVSIMSDGEVSDKHRINYAEIEGSVYYWTTIVEVPDNDGETNA